MSQIFYYLGHEQFQPEVLVRHAQLAEEAGFDGIFISEHFNPWVADKGAAGFAFSTLGAIAQATKKVKLMTGVVAPLYRYHPAVVAQAAATIDRLSNGRFMLGVGTGEAINEVPLGYEFPNYKERSDRMIEALTIMSRLFKGEKLTFDGKYYKTTNAKLYSPPLHYIPSLLAAGGPKSAALAREHADGLIVSVKDPNESLKTINPTEEKVLDKPFIITASRWTVYAQNNDEAWEALLPWRGLRAPSRNTATDPEELQKEADTMPKEEILSRYTIVKTPQDYIETYKPLIDELHADIVCIQTTSTNQEELINLLGKEVLPELHSH
ncbi:MAG TPA: TIGR03557 family F420-dependent LLM class oxidoreductase [Candidatus Saccharimonadales bacterium]|nr:TIGR03557 family F420-dependent LLM class oxidoreductase [Candidatus Saccharimonadales bacterium]